MSSSESNQSGGSITLEQFIALNDELAALVRAGVPLERGLIEAGRDLRGRLGSVSTNLGTRLGEGVRLPEALSTAGGGFPDVYRAVVEAGVRSGRLSQALEGMAAIARGYAEARQAIGMALLYPVLVLCVAYALAVLFVVQIAPRFVSAFEVLGLPRMKTLDFFQKAGESVVYWVPILPILLVVAAIRWAWSGRSVVMDAGPLGPILNRVPVVGTMIGYFRSANFAGLLSLLIDHRVPLDEAVRLAGDASGDRVFRAASATFAESIRRGDGPSTVPSSDLHGLPPLLSWMLTDGRRQADLAPALAHLASTYRRKATSRGEVLRLILPTVCLLAIGVGAVAAYAVMLFLPLTTLWNELASPTNM